MKKHVHLLAVAALVVSLTSTALAREVPPPSASPAPRVSAGPGTSNVTVTSSVVTTYTNPQTDPTVLAALAALNTGLSRYDSLVSRVLNHTQKIDHAAALKHADWFSQVPLNEPNVNGYQAYLTQRLHLDPDQAREVARVEEHLINEVSPLYTAYLNAYNHAVAERRAALARAWRTPGSAVAVPSSEAEPRLDSIRGMPPTR